MNGARMVFWVTIVLFFTGLIAVPPAADADTAEVDYLKAIKYFNKCWEEKNPRLAFRYLEQAKSLAKAALEKGIGEDKEKQATEIVELAAKYDIQGLEKAFAQAVESKTVIKWMTKAEVKRCLGKPDDAKGEKTGTTRTWIYKGDRTLVFEGDYLVEMKLIEKDTD